MNNVSSDLFELKNARDLFKEIQQAVTEYHSAPNSRLLLFLLFSLNHLREWIAGSDPASIEKKRSAGVELLPHEKFSCEIFEMEEFKIIKNICNRSKHHTIRSAENTSVEFGLTCNDLCTDSLNQKYYRIDGIDSRKIFAPVIEKYHNWFRDN